MSSATAVRLLSKQPSPNTGRDDSCSCISMFNATAATAAAIVTYLLSTTTTNHAPKKLLGQQVVVGTAIINTTASVEIIAPQHLYQADQPNKSAVQLNEVNAQQSTRIKHPHFYGLKKKKKDAISNADNPTGTMQMSNHPLTGTIVIGSVFLFITLSITAAVIVFCRKRNTVFVFNKSEQQEDEEADDESDLELDNLSMSLEEWAAQLSLASCSSSHTSLTELEMQRNLFLPLHYDVVTYDEEEKKQRVTSEKHQMQVSEAVLKKWKMKKLSKGLRKQLARQRQLEQFKQIQEEEATSELSAHNNRATTERQEPSLFYRKDDRGGYSQMIVSAVAQTPTESSTTASPRKITDELATSGPSKQVGIRLAQHTLDPHVRRINTSSKSIGSDLQRQDSVLSLLSAIHSSRQKEEHAPTPPPRQPRMITSRPWLANTTASKPYQAPTELRVRIQQQPGVARTVLQPHPAESGSAHLSSQQDDDDDEEAASAALISDAQEVSSCLRLQGHIRCPSQSADVEVNESDPPTPTC